MLKTVIILTTGILSLSTASIFIRLCHDVPPIMIATYRMVFAGIILLLLHRVFSKKKLFDLNTKTFLLCCLSGLFLSVHFVSWIASFRWTSIANSVVLVNTNPIFVGLFSYIIFKEKHSVYLLSGIVLSFTGTLVMLFSASQEALSLFETASFRGDLLALTGSLMASGYLIIGSRIRKNMGVFQYITIVYSICAIILLFVSILTKTPFTGYSQSSYVYMLLLTILPQLIGHTSFNWGLRHISSSSIAVTILGEPVGAILLAYLVFGEFIDINQAIGIVLIFSAIMLSYYKKTPCL